MTARRGRPKRSTRLSENSSVDDLLEAFHIRGDMIKRGAEDRVELVKTIDRLTAENAELAARCQRYEARLMYGEVRP